MCGLISLIASGLIIYYFVFKMNIFNINKEKWRIPIKEMDIEHNRKKNQKRHETDKILDKINKVGYNNLTNEEKRFLKNQK